LTIYVFICGLASCASNPSQVIPANQCKTGEICIVKGTLIVGEGMGSVRDQSGCVAVALPQDVPDSWNEHFVRAIGKIYQAPDYPGLITYKLKGRNVDAESCYSGMAMFVDRIELDEAPAP
jgi:hypothetical protein